MKPRALFALIFLAVLTAIPTMVSAAFVHYFDCDQCHRADATWNTVDGNGVCITCHDSAGNPSFAFGSPRPDDGATSGVISPGFASGDASAAFGNNPAPGLQNSHNWGAKDNNPAAGATPASSAMYNSRRGASRGFVSCYKCHDPHTYVDADYLVAGNEKMLRTANLPAGDGTSQPTEQNVEAMCTECHLDWASVVSADRGFKSHPIDVADYEALAAGDPRFISFNPPAVTADGNQMKLLAGNKIGCSTCHGIHGTSSDGANDGRLLKGPGASINATAVCTACHTYQTHPSSTGPGTELGCLVCHSGHSYNDGTPNYFVLRSEVNVPGGVSLATAGTTVSGLRYNSATDPDANFATYCTGCHGPLDNTAPGGISAGIEDHSTGHDQCTMCHSHYDPVSPDKSFAVGAGGCNSCHGAPPSLNSSGPDGYAAGYDVDPNYKAELTSPHVTHATSSNPVMSQIACAVCHTSFSANHNDGNFQNVLEAADTKPALLTTGGLTPAYTKTGSGTCSAVYCHSNGLGTPVAGAVTWADGATTGAITGCSACHDDAASNIGSTGPKNNTAAHAKHVARFTCNVCHDSTAISGAAVNIAGGKHINGSVELAYDTAYNLGAANLTGTAASASGCTVYCHSNGDTNGTLINVNVAWSDTGAAGQCGACHQVAAADDTTTTINGGALPDAHAKHIAAGVACTTCHTTNGMGATHLDGAVSLTAGAADLSTCNVCHGSSTGGTGADAEPTWTLAASVTCATCHTGAAIAVFGGATGPGSYMDVTDFYTTGHGDATLTGAPDCTGCHDSAAAGHFDGDSADDRLIGAVATNDAFCNTCHTTQNAHFASTGGSSDGDSCYLCHNPHKATNGDKMLIVGSGYDTSNGLQRADYANGAGTGICQTCHASGAVLHFDNTGLNESATHQGSNVCTSCHTHSNTPAFMYGAGTSCDGCHGFPPTSAAHTVHAPDSYALDILGLSNIDKDVVDRSACANCHEGAELYTYNTATDQGNSLNHGLAATRPDNMTTVGYTGSNCTSACHDGASGVTAAWTDASLACDACHYQAVDPTQAANTSNLNPVSAGHNAHFAGGGAVVCTDCHDAVADTTHITDQSGASEFLKIQGMATALQNEALVIAGAGFNTSTDSCATASCHNDARPGDPVPTSAWGTDDANCTQCHLAAPISGSHSVHIPLNNDCATCHASAVKDVSYNSANHLDNDIDVIAGSYPNNRAQNSPFTTCSTASCHSTVQGEGAVAGTTTLTPVWGGSITCGDCHAAVPVTGSHNEHLADASVTCEACHTTAGDGSVNPTANHIDNNIDVANGYPAVNPIADGTYSTCSTASCHSTVQGEGAVAGSVVPTPAWGTATVCGECHVAVPTTGSHSEHLAVAGVTCASCHATAGDGSVLPTANHADANIDVINGYPVVNPIADGTYSTCNAASCHDNGTGTLVTTPAWGQSAACTECHTTIPDTAAHGAHLNQTITSAINCTDCHAGAVWGLSATTTGHRDGDVDVTGLYGYPIDAVKGAPYDTCATSYCHGDNMPKGTVSGTTNAPNWGDTSTGCIFCHDVAAAPAAIASHTGKALTDCWNCHDNALASGTGFVDPNLHINGTLEGGGDSCSDCHFNVGTDVRASGAHAAHNIVAFNGLLSNGDYGSTAAGWYNVTYTGGVPSFSCGYCHPSTVVGHMTKQVSLNPADAGATGTVKAQNDGSAVYNLGVCSATYCHSDGVNVAAGVSPNWATGSISGNCNDCHGNSPTTAAHGVHEIGIHYEELYSGSTGLITATGTVGSGAGHGDPAVSSTISCYTCHSGTVTDNANAANTTCGSCHSDTNNIATGNELARILSTSSTHINGVKDVVFADMTGFKSKAQLRDNLADADDGSNILSNIWNRLTGYKGATDRDEVKVAFAVPSFTQGADTCSAVACHNGNVATWETPQNNCMACHTSLPK